VTARILVGPEQAEDPIMPELRDSPVPGPPWLPGPALLGLLAGASMFRVSAFHEVGGFSARLWLGGEEELLALDLAARGWWMCWVPAVVIHHYPSTGRDPRGRRRLGIRNTLWTAWLRRPVSGAVRRTVAVLRSIPRDRTSMAALVEALSGLGWGAPGAPGDPRRGRARTALAGGAAAALGGPQVRRLTPGAGARVADQRKPGSMLDISACLAL
jgi:hypothetical protein